MPKTTGQISSKELIKILRSICQKVTYPDDRSYNMISPRTFADIMQISKVPHLEYHKETRDCDDFSRGVRGWLSVHNLGNYLVMKVKIKRKNGTVHSLLGTLVKTDEGHDIVLGEPQTGFVVDEPGHKLLRIIV